MYEEGADVTVIDAGLWPHFLQGGEVVRMEDAGRTVVVRMQNDGEIERFRVDQVKRSTPPWRGEVIPHARPD